MNQSDPKRKETQKTKAHFNWKQAQNSVLSQNLKTIDRICLEMKTSATIVLISLMIAMTTAGEHLVRLD